MSDYLFASMITRAIATTKLDKMVVIGQSSWTDYIDVKYRLCGLLNLPSNWNKGIVYVIGEIDSFDEIFRKTIEKLNNGFIVVQQANNRMQILSQYLQYSIIVLPLDNGIAIVSKGLFNVPLSFTYVDVKEYRERITSCIDGEVLVQVPKDWKSTKRVHGWLHIALIESGDLIAAELHGRIMQSGLYDVTDVIHVSILGDVAIKDRLIEYIFSKYKKYEISYYSDNLSKYEWPSLINMRRLAESKDLNCWYVHTKGASNCRADVPRDIQDNLRTWRDLMCYYVINKHQECQYLLDSGYDTVGPLFKYSTGANYRHYAGNFWWATADYLRKLSESTLEDLSSRMGAEEWLCKIPDAKHFNQFWIETNDLYGFNRDYSNGPFLHYKEHRMSLDEIALECGTDKSSKTHYYTRYYEQHLKDLRHKELKLLEIGVHNGFSLKMWKRYFLKASIVGIDIESLQHLSEDRITVLQGSQNDPEFLKRVNDEHGPFDIVIDDGSHHNVHMRTSFDTLFPLLASKGIYVIEDLHCCYWDSIYQTGKPLFTEHLKTLIDDVNSRGKSDQADHEKDRSSLFFNAKYFGEFTEMEKRLKAIHFYRSICFLMT